MNWRLYLWAAVVVWLAAFFVCLTWLGAACILSGSGPTSTGWMLVFALPSSVVVVLAVALAVDA